MNCLTRQTHFTLQFQVSCLKAKKNQLVKWFGRKYTRIDFSFFFPLKVMKPLDNEYTIDFLCSRWFSSWFLSFDIGICSVRFCLKLCPMRDNEFIFLTQWLIFTQWIARLSHYWLNCTVKMEFYSLGNKIVSWLLTRFTYSSLILIHCSTRTKYEVSNACTLQTARGKRNMVEPSTLLGVVCVCAHAWQCKLPFRMNVVVLCASAYLYVIGRYGTVCLCVCTKCFVNFVGFSFFVRFSVHFSLLLDGTFARWLVSFWTIGMSFQNGVEDKAFLIEEKTLRRHVSVNLVMRVQHSRFFNHLN